MEGHGTGCQSRAKSRPVPSRKIPRDTPLENQVRKWFIKERHLKGKSKSTAVHSPHLKIWFAEYESHPYPTKDQRAELALIMGLTEDQVRNWFNIENDT